MLCCGDGRSRIKCSPFFSREISKKCLWNCKRTMQRVTAKVLNWKIFPFDQLIDELIVCQKMPSSIVALLPFSNSLSLSFKALYFPWRRKRASSWHGKATADFDSVIDRIIVSWVWCITFIFCALALTKYRRWIGKKECVYREKILSLTSWVLLETGTPRPNSNTYFILTTQPILITQKEFARNWNVRN